MQIDKDKEQLRWYPYLDGGPIASEEFMEDADPLPVQERNIVFDIDTEKSGQRRG